MASTPPREETLTVALADVIEISVPLERLREDAAEPVWSVPPAHLDEKLVRQAAEVAVRTKEMVALARERTAQRHDFDAELERDLAELEANARERAAAKAAEARAAEVEAVRAGAKDAHGAAAVPPDELVARPWSAWPVGVEQTFEFLYGVHISGGGSKAWLVAKETPHFRQLVSDHKLGDAARLKFISLKS